MKTSIISVAHFAGTDEIKNAILNSDELRRKTLNKCYSIPGYESFTLKEKNKVYDAIKKQFTA